jgi:hypothetical protein
MCQIDGCTQPVYRKRMCGSHYGRWYRHGDPLASGQMGRPPATEIGYDAMHYRIRAARGRPDDYLCVDCGCQAEEWSLCNCCDELRDHHGRYSLDVSCYVTRCIPCHRRTDRNYRKERAA